MRKIFLFIAMCVFMSAQAVDVTKFAQRSSEAMPVQTRTIRADKSRANVHATPKKARTATVKKANQAALAETLDFDHIEIQWWPSYSQPGQYDYAIALYKVVGGEQLPYVVFDIYAVDKMEFAGTYTVDDGNLDLAYASDLMIPNGDGYTTVSITDATLTITEGKDNLTFAGSITADEIYYTYSFTLAVEDIIYFDAEHYLEPISPQTVGFTVTGMNIEMSALYEKNLITVQFETIEGITLNFAYYSLATDLTELPNGTFSFGDEGSDDLDGKYVRGKTSGASYPANSYVIVPDGENYTPYFIQDGTVTVSGDGNENKAFVVDVESFYGTKFQFAYPTSSVKHKITVAVAFGQSGMGSVNINGSGTSGNFAEGATITLNAVANEGYAFISWSDGSHDASHDVKVGIADATYTANFHEKAAAAHTISVEVESGQEEWGYVDIDGWGSYGEFEEGADLKLIATSKDNTKYTFDHWDDGNTDNPRNITVGTSDKTYIASFKKIESGKVYEAYIGDVQFNENNLVMTSENNAAIKSGAISYDPNTSTLTLNAAVVETDKDALFIQEEDAVINVAVVGDCKLTSTGGTYSAVNIDGAASVKFIAEGEGAKLTLKADYIGLITSAADITFENLTTVIVSDEVGLQGLGSEVLTIIGCNLQVHGKLTGSIVGWNNLDLQFCAINKPAGAAFESSSGDVELSGSTVTDNIEIKPWPLLTVSPVDKGSGKFILKSKDTGREFTNQGWFEKGDEVTVTAEEADGFAFARWLDDSDWKDKDLRMKATRKFTKGAGDEKLSALFYFEPESDADWFGVNKDEFVKFSFNDHAAKVARANNSLSSVKGGDYDGENWIYIEDESVMYFEFDGTLKDGEDILGKDGKMEKYNKKSISDATDMAYDILDGDLYAVAGKKLYEITKNENKEIATFEFEETETAVVAIAVNGDGVMYALGVGDGTEGVLYTVDISGKKAKLKLVGKKENGGKIGHKVTDEPQALAFDIYTGELFWGAPDYLRIINTNKMTTYVVGDLDQKEGKQGAIQSLHCLTQLIEVGVGIAEGQEDWGTATVGESTTDKKHKYVYEDFLPGEMVTITAEAKEGYHFDHWEIEGDKKHKQYTDQTMEFEAEEITYIAYFAEGEGIESITIDPTKNIQKVLIDGVIYILRNGRIYTITGQDVK